MSQLYLGFTGFSDENKKGKKKKIYANICIKKWRKDIVRITNSYMLSIKILLVSQIIKPFRLISEYYTSEMCLVSLISSSHSQTNFLKLKSCRISRFVLEIPFDNFGKKQFYVWLQNTQLDQLLSSREREH